MALPFIFIPAGLPLPLTRGHAQTIDDQFDHVPALQGEGRKRRLYTASNRTARLIWLLTETQMLAFDAWFESTLDAGKRQFACPVAKLGPGGIEYWTAEFIDVDTDDPIASPTHLWEVSASVLLTGEPSDTLPDTGELDLLTLVTLGGTAALSVPAPLALETLVTLGAVTSLALETVVSLGEVDNGAPASDVDADLRWVLMEYPYAPGYAADVTDDAAAERSWIERRNVSWL